MVGHPLVTQAAAPPAPLSIRPRTLIVTRKKDPILDRAEILQHLSQTFFAARNVSSALTLQFNCLQLGSPEIGEKLNMSERGHGRGGGRGHSGGPRGRGGGRGGGAGGQQQQQEKPKKESILDLSKYMDKQVTVKFSGGREGVTAD